MSGVNVNLILGFEYNLVNPKNGIAIRSKLYWKTYKSILQVSQTVLVQSYNRF
jgi:hypothetical protein